MKLVAALATACLLNLHEVDGPKGTTLFVPCEIIESIQEAPQETSKIMVKSHHGKQEIIILYHVQEDMQEIMKMIRTCKKSA